MEFQTCVEGQCGAQPNNCSGSAPSVRCFSANAEEQTECWTREIQNTASFINLSLIVVKDGNHCSLEEFDLARPSCLMSLFSGF